MELIKILLSILVVSGIGYTIYSLLLANNKDQTILKLALSYGIGFMLISYQMLIYDFLNIKWSGFSLFTPWIIPLSILLIRNPKELRPIIRSFRGSRVLLILCVLAIFFALIQTLLRPVSAWDAIASWFIGGKAFFINRSIDPSFYLYANYDLPPFMHLMQTSVNIFLDKFNDTSSLIFYFLFSPSILIVFYFMLREFLSSNKAMLFTFLLASSQNFIRHSGRFDIGNSDLPLAFYFIISVYFLQKYISHARIGYLILGLGCLVSGAMIKNDGIPFAFSGIVVLSYFIMVKKKYKAFLIFPLVIWPLVYWRFFFIFHDLPGTIYHLSNFQMQRALSIFTLMTKELFNLQRWNFAWIFILFGIFSLKKFKHVKYLGLVILFQVFSYSLIYFVSPIGPNMHIPNSFDRLLLQILPTTLYFIVVNLFKKNVKDKN